MAGPYLDVIVSLREGSNQGQILERISKMVAAEGLGILFGVEPIRRLYDEEGTMLDELTREVRNPMVLSITSNSQATDALDIFQQQLNPVHTDPAKAGLLRLLREICSMAEIQSALFIVLDSMGPYARFIPRHEMPIQEFLEWLASYHEKELTRAGQRGGQGIFKIAK